MRIGDSDRAQMRVGTDGAGVLAEVGSDRIVPEGTEDAPMTVRVPVVDATFARGGERGARVVEGRRPGVGERSGVVEDIGATAGA